MKFFVLISLCAVLLIAPAPYEGAAERTRTLADGWQALGDSGIEYRYGLNREDISESVFFQEEFLETTTNHTTSTDSFTVPIPRNWSLVDFFYIRAINETKANPTFGDWGNLTIEEGPGWAGTFGTKEPGSFNHVNWRLEGIVNESWTYEQQYEAGLAGPDRTNETGVSWWTDGPVVYNSSQLADELGDPSIENVTIPVVNWRGEILTSINVSFYYIQYIWYNRWTDWQPEVVFEEVLMPAFAIVEVEYEELELLVNAKVDSQVEIGGSFNLSASYEEQVWGHDVEIKLPGHYHLAYRAIENATGSYSLSSGFSMHAKISYNSSVEVTFANGSSIPVDGLPQWLHSTNISIEGSWSFKYEESASFFGVTALQGIVQGVLTKLSNESYADLLIWGGWKPGRMFGYVDLNGNDRLDVGLNGSEIVSDDVVYALGLPEGIHLEGSASATGIEDARFYYSDSSEGTFESYEKNETTETGSFDFVHGFDPDAHQGTTTLDWQEPSYDSETGKAEFSWALNRNDWPVLWYVANRTHSDEIIDIMDFKDTYTLEIDTAEGIATLTNDYEQSAVTDPTLAAMVEDLSLATYHRDIFLSVSALEKGMDPAKAQQTSVNDFEIGGVSVATAVFGGSKANYTIGTPPTEHTTSTTVLNLLTMSGQIGDPSTIEGDPEEGDPFVSPVAQRVALGMVQLTADGLEEEHEGNVTWILSENIVIVSYPEWGGEGPLVHDPTFTASFAQKPAEGPESSQTGTDTESEPDSSAGAFASGFEFLVAGLAVIPLVLYKKRK